MTSALEETHSVAKKIVENYKPEKIIAFGSVIRGEETTKSDIDLLIIKNDAKRRPLRVKEVFEAVRGMKRNYPLDPLVYTQEEIEHRLSLGDYFIKSIMDHGTVLYG